MVESTPLSSGKEKSMARKSIFREYNEYIVFWKVNGETHSIECVGTKSAIDVYRNIRRIYGNSVRIAKVVINFGEEI